MIIIAIVSIVGITGLVWLVGKVLPFRVCPICAGVSGTWLWMLVASLLEYQIDLVIVAMLLGGSVVGIAYQLEKRLVSAPSESRGASASRLLLWKALFIPAGFVSAYSLVVSQWVVLAGSAGFAGILALVFLKDSGKQHSINKTESLEEGLSVEELKKKMENCC